MDNGRVPSEPGSRASTEPVSAVSALPGFDPSRWGDLSCALANARYALEYWEREAIVWRKSVKEYDFTHGPLERGRREIATLREMDNLVRPIAYRCDSDGSPKGGDAQQGSVEDDSAVTQPIAQPDPARLERERVVAWQTIESAPKDGTKVLVLVDGHMIEAAFDRAACEWAADQWGLGFGHDPTHWMRLPEPPDAS